MVVAGELRGGGGGETHSEVDPEADDGGGPNHLPGGAVQTLRVPAADSGGLQALGGRGGGSRLSSFTLDVVGSWKAGGELLLRRSIAFLGERQ